MRGFTLLEILVTVLILGILFVGVFGVLNVGNIIFKEDITLVGLQQQVRRAMDTMINEIRESSSSHINPVCSNSTITFNTTPAVYGDPWAGPISYYLDVNDANNDGVVNQVIREYPQLTRKILANDISSLSFCLTGNIVEIQVAAQKNIGARQLCFPAPCETPRKTLKETVWLRN